MGLGGGTGNWAGAGGGAAPGFTGVNPSSAWNTPAFDPGRQGQAQSPTTPNAQPNPAHSRVDGAPPPNPMPHQGGTPNTLAPPGGTPNALPGQAAVHHVLPGQGANAQPLAGQANPMAGWVQGGAPGAQLVAPATALAGTSVTIGPRGSVGQPMNGPMTPMQAAAQPPQGAVAAPVAGSVVKSAAQVPLQPTPALANPRAQAAAAAQPGMGLVPPPAATLPNPASVRAGQGQPGPVVVQASSPARGVASGAQAVAVAQAALAQTLGRVTAGQMTAGGAAMALAEAQLALRAGRLAMAQAQAQMGLPAAAQGQRGTPGAPVPLAQPSVAPRTAANAGAAALGTAPGRVGAQALPASAQAPRAGQLEPLANKGGAALRDGGQKQAELGAAAAMPKKLATALAMAPKLRKRGSHDRVEKVDSFTPRMQSPEMEDEDFWDAAGDEDDDWADDAPPQDEGAATSAAEAAAQHYRALQLWLQANDQQALLRELALGQRVLVLAPPDKTQQVVAPATALAGTSVTIGPGGVATPGRPGNGGRGGWGRARLHAKPSRRGPQSWRQGQPVWQPVTSSFLAKLAASPRPICAASY